MQEIKNRFALKKYAGGTTDVNTQEKSAQTLDDIFEVLTRNCLVIISMITPIQITNEYILVSYSTRFMQTGNIAKIESVE